MLWPIALFTIAGWLRWIRHRGDLSDEVMNRFMLLLTVFLTVMTGALLLKVALRVQNSS